MTVISHSAHGPALHHRAGRTFAAAAKSPSSGSPAPTDPVFP